MVKRKETNGAGFEERRDEVIVKSTYVTKMTDAERTIAVRRWLAAKREYHRIQREKQRKRRLAAKQHSAL